MGQRIASILALSFVACAFVVTPGRAQEFTYNPPGSLTPGSGEGRADLTVYVPGMRFPIENAPAYLNSQVWGNGGSSGPGGTQCDAVNYSYPWWDNFCETRTWEMPLCPSGTGHQGQDIRPSTCADDTHWCVAAEDGTITSIGTYSVYLTTADGTVHRYLHMAPSSLVVSVGDTVSRGDHLGHVSNAYGDSSTTIHLHYDLNMNVDGYGAVYVPPYMSLVRSYEALIDEQGITCGVVPVEGTVLDNQSNCFLIHGPMSTWRYVDTTGYDGDLYWSYVWENEASNWAEWLLFFDRSGTYEIEVYITPEYAQSQDTRYSVRHGEDVTELRIDQSSGDGWLSIGTFDFEAGVLQNVAVYDGPGEELALQRQFVADAIRVTNLTPPELDPDPAPDPDDVGRPDAGSSEPEVSAPDLLTEWDTSVGPDGTDTGNPQTPDAVDVTVNTGCGCATVDGPKMPVPLLLLVGIALLSRRRAR